MDSTQDIIVAKFLEDTFPDKFHPKSQDLREKFFPNSTSADFRSDLLEFLEYANIDSLSIKRNHMDPNNIYNKHNEYRWDITWFHLFGLLASNFQNHPRNLLKQPSQVTITRITKFYDSLHTGIEELPTFLKNIIKTHPSYEYSKALCNPNIGLKKLLSSSTNTYFLNLLGYSFNNISLEDLLRDIDFQNNSMVNLVNQKDHPYSLANIFINANLYDFLLHVLIMLFDIIDNLNRSKRYKYLIEPLKKGEKETTDPYFHLLEEIITVSHFNKLSLLIEKPPSNIIDSFSDSPYYEASHKLIDNLLGLYIASFLK